MAKKKAATTSKTEKPAAKATSKNATKAPKEPTKTKAAASSKAVIKTSVQAKPSAKRVMANKAAFETVEMPSSAISDKSLESPMESKGVAVDSPQTWKEGKFIFWDSETHESSEYGFINVGAGKRPVAFRKSDVPDSLLPSLQQGVTIECHESAGNLETTSMRIKPN